jgi:hypothetical protein
MQCRLLRRTISDRVMYPGTDAGGDRSADNEEDAAGEQEY